MDVCAVRAGECCSIEQSRCERSFALHVQPHRKNLDQTSPVVPVIMQYLHQACEANAPFCVRRKGRLSAKARRSTPAGSRRPRERFQGVAPGEVSVQLL
jgi:hypothetical protein